MNLQKKLLVLALSTAFAPAAQAANKYWACANGTWNTTCWSSFSGGGAGASQPGSADFVYLLNSSTSNKTVTYASTSNPTLPGLTINATGLGTMTLAQAKDTLTVYEEKIGTTNGGKGAFIQSGGTHTVTTRLILGDVTGSTGTYTQSGGAITVATLLLGHDNNNATNGNGTGVYNLSGGVLTATSSESVGGYGSGIFNHSGGTNTMNFGISLSIGGSATAGSSGTYILSDTGNLSSSDVYVGSAQGGVSSALFTQNGGTHTSVSLNIGYATVGTGNVNSTYTLNAGSLTSQSVTVGISGTGIFNQNGGTNTVTGSLRLGDGNGGGGTYNLNGGTLTLNLIDRLGFGTSYGAVNIDGGTMQLGTSGDISLDSFRIGNSIGSTGSFTMASVYQNIQSNTEIIGNYGTGTFTQTGGTHTVGGVVGSALTLGA